MALGTRVFCASGLRGVERNLTRGEMVEQVVRLRNLLPPDERLTNLVVMGMGESLANLDKDLSGEDVLVCGDDAAARARVVELASAVTGRPGVDVGALRQARVLEPFTAVLIAVNKRYKTRAGVVLTHVDLSRA